MKNILKILAISLLCMLIGVMYAGNDTKSDSITMLLYNQVFEIRGEVESFARQIDSLKKDVFHIRDEMDTVCYTINDYVSGESKGWNWNMIGAVGSVISIFVMIWVYWRTTKQTKQQINSQHNDTERLIKQQQTLSMRQIKKMQEHSNERTRTLTDLGQQIQISTDKIKSSVEHLEGRFVTERYKIRIESLYSLVINNYEALCEELEIEYDHFTKNPNNSIIHQRASRIKESILEISQILSNYFTENEIPDDKAYLNSLDEVVNRPSFQNKRKQIINFKTEGKEYNNQIKECIRIIFYK